MISWWGSGLHSVSEYVGGLCVEKNHNKVSSRCFISHSLISYIRKIYFLFFRWLNEVGRYKCHFILVQPMVGLPPNNCAIENFREKEKKSWLRGLILGWPE